MTQPDGDSPLSMVASIAGILTFVVAISAALYVRWTYLRNADAEFLQVKANLNWYKTESDWMYKLIRASPRDVDSFEYAMYTSVMDDLRLLEERLLEMIAGIDEKFGGQSLEGGKMKRWPIVGRGWKGGVALGWMPVRGDALELVRKRDALASRVLFAQMSMLSSRVREQEIRWRKRDEAEKESVQRMESMIHVQSEKLDRLEGLWAVKINDEGTMSRRSSSDYDHEKYETASTSWQSDLNDHSTTASPQKAISARRYAIPEF